MATHIGRRPENQDRAAVADRWALVSDGVGGAAGGARAAELTVTTAVAALRGSRRLDEAAVVGAVEAANAVVRRGQRADPRVASMAATLTLGVQVASGRWLIAHAGDSMAWHVAANPRPVERLTAPHTFAADLAAAGAITQAEIASHPGRNAITRGIGLGDAVGLDLGLVTLRPGEALVIASDGLAVVAPDTIGDVVRTAATAEEAAGLLVAAALARDAQDNVTVTVTRLPGCE